MRSFEHHEIMAFKYLEGRFTVDRAIKFPKKLNFEEFYKPLTPDTLKPKIESSFSSLIEFSDVEPIIEYRNIQNIMHMANGLTVAV